MSSPTPLAYPVQAVSFDAGFTLIHTRAPVGEIYASALHRRGHTADSSIIEKRFKAAFSALTPKGDVRVNNDTERMRWREMVRLSLHHDCPEEDFEAVFKELYEEFAWGKTWKKEIGVDEVLETLNSRGYRLILISNADSRFRQVLSELNLLHWFEKLFISAEIGMEKPDRRLFDEAESQLALPGHSILHIGDSVLHDGEGAKAAGWQYRILDPKGAHQNGHPTISSLFDLLSILPSPHF